MSRRRIIVMCGMGVVVAASAYWFTHRRDVAPSPEAPVAMRTPAVPPGAEAGKLDYIRKADTSADAMERCKNYPAPTGFDWPRATTDALCVDLLTPRLPGHQIDAWINEGKAAQLDRHFDGLLAGERDGSVPEGVFWFSYVRRFEVSSANVRSLIDEWIRQSPKSAHAHLALAGHHLMNAWGYRGEKYYSQIPGEDRDRMGKEVEAAVAAAQRAVELEPRLWPAYAIPVRLEPLGADAQVAEAFYARGLEQKPDSYYLRNAMMFRATPMWGGSLEEMDAIAADGMQHEAKNPRLLLLKATAASQRGFVEHHEERHDRAAPLYEVGLAIGPDIDQMRWGAYSQEEAGNLGRAVEYQSQVLRFRPDDRDIATSRARLLAKLGQVDWALAELERQVSVQANDNPAAFAQYVSILLNSQRYAEAETKLKQLLAGNPTHRWTNRELAKLYLYRLRRYADAKPHIDALFAQDPNDGGALLLQLDYLQNTGAPDGLRATAERFVAHADLDDAEQRAAHPRIVAWLKDPKNR